MRALALHLWSNGGAEAHFTLTPVQHTRHQTAVPRHAAVPHHTVGPISNAGRHSFSRKWTAPHYPMLRPHPHVRSTVLTSSTTSILREPIYISSDVSEASAHIDSDDIASLRAVAGDDSDSTLSIANQVTPDTQASANAVQAATSDDFHLRDSDADDIADIAAEAEAAVRHASHATLPVAPRSKGTARTRVALKSASTTVDQIYGPLQI